MKKIKMVMLILMILIIGATAWILRVYNPSALHKVGVIECGKDFADRWKDICGYFGSETTCGYNIINENEDFDGYLDGLEYILDITIEDVARAEIEKKIQELNMPTIVVSPIKSQMLWTYREEPKFTDITLLPIRGDLNKLKPTVLYVYVTECTTFDTPDYERLSCGKH